MALQILTDLDFNNVAKITGLANGTAAQDAATISQLNSAIEGLSWKASARVTSAANINLASPGATIDGITMVTNDRVLVRSQSAGAENGVYIWNGASTAMTRSADCSTARELEQAVIAVEEGTSAGASYRQTTVNFTLESGAVAWTSFTAGAGAASETVSGIAEIATQAETDTGTDDVRFITPLKLSTYSGRAKRYSVDFGDGAATSYTITHNLGTRDVHIAVRRNSGAYDYVLVDTAATTTNTATIVFATAPTSNAFRAIVTA